MKNTIRIYLNVQFILYLQFTVFFLKPFNIPIESELAKSILVVINLFFYTTSIGLFIYLQKMALAILRQTYLLLTIVLYCVMSLMWSDLAAVSNIKLLNLILQLIQMLTVVLAAWHWQINLISLLKRVTLFIVFINVDFYILFPNLALSRALGEDGRYDCLMPSPNNLAQMAVLTVALHLPRKMTRFNVEELLAVGFSLICLYLSGSATGLICILLLVGINISLLIRRNWWTLLLSGTALISLVTILLLPQDNINIFGLFNRDANLTGRTVIWASALADQERDERTLQGFGYGGFWDPSGKLIHSNDFLDGFMQAHNGYLDTYLQLGYVGVFLLLLLVIQTIRLVYKHITQPAFRNGCLVMIAVLVNNLTESSLLSPKHPNWLLYTILYFTLIASFLLVRVNKPVKPISVSSNLRMSVPAS